MVVSHRTHSCEEVHPISKRLPTCAGSKPRDVNFQLSQTLIGPARRPLSERADALGLKCPVKLGVRFLIRRKQIVPYGGCTLLIDYLKGPSLTPFGNSVYLHANRCPIATHLSAKRRIFDLGIFFLAHSATYPF